MTRTTLALAAVLTPALAIAQTLTDFARGVDIRTPAASSIYRVSLPEDVYSTVTRADLGDVRVFNAAGETVPHTMRQAPAPDPAVEAYVAVPSFPVSERTVAGMDLAAVKIDERGTVLEVRRAPGPGEAVSAYLADLSALKTAVVGLRLEFGEPQGAGFLARIQVQGSDDLNRWQTIAPAAAIARMRHGEHVLTQNEVDLPPTRVRYLRVMWPKELSAVALASVSVRPESAGAAPAFHWRTVTGRPASDEGAATVYDARGHFPVERLDLELADSNDAVSVVVQSRPDDSSSWLVRYRGLFYSLSEGSDTIRNEPARIGRTTHAAWLVQPSGSAGWRPDRLPRLKLGWRPDELLFLARGEGPYTLAYGHANVGGEEAPVDALLASLGNDTSSGRIADATVGNPRELAGAAALNPAPPWRQITLWAVLIAAVAIVGVVAHRALQEPRRLVLLLAAAAGSHALAEAQQPPPPKSMSFFLTSTGRGFGANLGGLRGADAHCQQLATAAGSGGRTWRAYLSAPGDSGAPPVHARDRIGKGPWTNAAGVQIAASVEDLHGDGNAIDAGTALTEKGTRVGPGRHDVLTGSNADGTLATGARDATCRGWTSHAEGRAMLGHHNRTGGGQDGTSWNSAHLSRGCSQLALRASLGDGLFYCFAAD